MRMRAKNYSISELVKDPSQLFFMMLGVFTVAIIPSFTLGCSNFIKITYKEKPDGYQLPKFSDLRISIIFAAIFAFLEILFCKGFTSYFGKICREQKNTKERELRSQKAAINL